jgi:hypothetical protein
MGSATPHREPVVAIEARCEQLLRSAEALGALPLPRSVERALGRMHATRDLRDALAAQQALETLVETARLRQRCEVDVITGVVAPSSSESSNDAADDLRRVRVAKVVLAGGLALGIGAGWCASHTPTAGGQPPLAPYHGYAVAEVVAVSGVAASPRDRCTVEISIVPRDGASADCAVDVVCPGFEQHARPMCFAHHLDEVVHVDDESVHIDGTTGVITLVDHAAGDAAPRRAVLRIVAR